MSFFFTDNVLGMDRSTWEQILASNLVKYHCSNEFINLHTWPTELATVDSTLL